MERYEATSRCFYLDESDPVRLVHFFVFLAERVTFRTAWIDVAQASIFRRGKMSALGLDPLFWATVRVYCFQVLELVQDEETGGKVQNISHGYDVDFAGSKN